MRFPVIYPILSAALESRLTPDDQRGSHRRRAEVSTGHDRTAPVVSGVKLCRRCHTMIGRFAPQVSDGGLMYHRQCYEAWHFFRYGRLPVLLPEEGGAPHRYRVFHYAYP